MPKKTTRQKLTKKSARILPKYESVESYAEYLRSPQAQKELALVETDAPTLAACHLLQRASRPSAAGIEAKFLKKIARGRVRGVRGGAKTEAETWLKYYTARRNMKIEAAALTVRLEELAKL